eukprot:CAMPEP_0195246378 /NCGR_PEP_ID=MMETSP0706-20130129/368_1 /TAXON_ID=33640 /ORGANISM="Asterionellopsis glacialis, Strain CCMP134" /LENGTH=149 /DNA_ID=CAMNT_0040297745 /DNA_START=177 /DNA_END=626 /DNA_ORIENTATION=-
MLPPQVFDNFLKRPNVSCLLATPERRQPRRNLKKRRNRGNRRQKAQVLGKEFWETADSRPLVNAEAREAGEDYWIDEKELQESLLREQAIKNRKAMEGEIPQAKLRAEVAAPYKQNWIGFFSVGIVVLATIINQFPELLNHPIIEIPDI